MTTRHAVPALSNDYYTVVTGYCLAQTDELTRRGMGASTNRCAEIVFVRLVGNVVDTERSKVILFSDILTSAMAFL
jgi:hypothetical protein